SSIADSLRFAVFSHSMHRTAPKTLVSTAAPSAACCFPPTVPARTSHSTPALMSPAALLFPESRRARFHKTFGSLPAASEFFALSFALHQIPPAFPTLPLFPFPNHHRPRLFLFATMLPADRAPSSRSLPSFPASESVAAQSAPTLKKKDMPAIHSHSKTSHQTHHHSARFRVPHECRHKPLPEFRARSERGQSSAAQGRKTLPFRGRAFPSRNRESRAGIDRMFLQNGSRAQVVPIKSIARASKNLRPVGAPDTPSEIFLFFLQPQSTPALLPPSLRTAYPLQRFFQLRGKPSSTAHAYRSASIPQLAESTRSPAVLRASELLSFRDRFAPHRRPSAAAQPPVATPAPSPETAHETLFPL